MSAELNKLLIKAYNKYKSSPEDSLVPLEAIKEYLELEGIDVEDISS